MRFLVLEQLLFRRERHRAETTLIEIGTMGFGMDTGLFAGFKALRTNATLEWFHFNVFLHMFIKDDLVR